MKPQTVRYIGNDPANGILIDWKMIHRALLSTGQCKKYPDPLIADPDQVGYIIDMSDRSRGKTTQKLVLGLLLYMAYGIDMQVIRQSKRMCEPKMIRDMYRTLIELDLIPEITDGRWNSIYYRGKRWYLCTVDEDGSIVEADQQHCTICHGLDESDDLKSTYNAPRGDIIYYDEFISRDYGYDDFVRFTDICKTIIRDRQSPIIYMSANTIDKNSPWFDELGIRREVETMHMGDSKTLSTDLGTHIYIEILAPSTSKQRSRVNRRFFGFNNPRLNSLSGRGEWATDTFQHIPAHKDQPPSVISGNVYLQYQGQDIRLMLVDDPRIGICVHAVPGRVHDDSIIITADDVTSPQHVFGLCRQTPLQLWWQLYDQNRWYYASNGLGATVRSYVGYVHSKHDIMHGL